MNTEEKEESKVPLFTIMPGVAIEDKNISPNAKILLSLIVSMTRTNGYCWAGNAHFAKIFGVHKNTISAWISELADNEYITVEILNFIDRKIFLLEKSVIPKQKVKCHSKAKK